VSVEFEPVRLGRRRRAIDSVRIGVAVVAAALALAVLKPWGNTAPTITAVSSPSPPPLSAAAEGSLPPVVPQRPTWLRVAGVISPRSAWGIRTIINGPNPEKDSELWVPVDVDRALEASAVVDPRAADVVALGITFPRTEAPLAVRIWLDRGDNELEWIDARPVDEVPGRGAYLFLRTTDGQPVLAWRPGRYRVDVLVGDQIRRIGVTILDRSRLLPHPDAPGAIASVGRLPPPRLEGLPVGLFAASDDASVSLPATAGPALDEAGAWLDLDRRTSDSAPRSFVARTHQPAATRLGVVLPPESTIRFAGLLRLAPFGSTADIVGGTMTASGEAVSYVAFAAPGGASWSPGVYALRAGWVDGAGAHDETWHVELRPGPVRPEPVLLSATRAWARLAGISGALLGWPESITGGLPPPELGPRYASKGVSTAIGCGDSIIPGGAIVVGFSGPVEADLAPVSATIQFPLADTGPMLVMTAAGAVPGLVVVAPILTAEFDGPAAYGFRAGSAPDAPGYSICVGLTTTP
jgi:hypothetical protein